MADLTINEGADFFARFIVKDEQGNVQDLTGYTGKSKFYDEAGGTLQGTFVVTLGTTNGYCDLSMEDADTDVLTPGSYVYDVFIENTGTDDVQRIVSGAVTVVQRITP